MHQPEYRDYSSGEYRLPWTYLHAIKDYTDMAAILEQIPGARAVINFVPILLDQLEDYSAQLRAYLSERRPLCDPLLAALVSETFPPEAEWRAPLVRACLRANEQRLINRFPMFRRLVDLAVSMKDDTDNLSYLGDQYLADMLTWYHLAWMGETVRRSDPRVQRLIEKARFFSLEDRRQLLEVIHGLIDAVIPRYRRLAENGQAELSMTPYAHPMVPLLLDFASAREAVPEMPLPATEGYPGGPERARWHVREGIAAFERHFGFVPQGCWPAEGGLSTETVRLLGEYGFKWTATGESVLRNSLARDAAAQGPGAGRSLHCVYRIDAAEPACFFRDDGLSDLIGFTYHDWHADDAVANMIHNLENIAKECKGSPDHVVSIVLDGENAWEAYPDNGYHFLTALYRRLVEHPALELTTFSDSLAGGIERCRLPSLVAGSWVYGTFSTWMGSPDKNRGWELLCEVKRTCDSVLASGALPEEQRQRILRQLAVCEGSDWCWWFGDYNPSDSVGDFERLYRLHLSNLYRLLGAQPPETLARSISAGGGQPQLGGVMRRGSEAR
ncbi:MAG: glycoside hydrolase [Gammaproteobacteria bacterium]|nr:glycoside hydrolase [Gammaproteobacteria bacterium]